MSLVLFSADVPFHDSIIDHDLETVDIQVTVWQNGHTITPSVRALDNKKIQVFGAAGARIVIIGFKAKPKPKAKPAPKPKEK